MTAPAMPLPPGDPAALRAAADELNQVWEQLGDDRNKLLDEWWPGPYWQFWSGTASARAVTAAQYIDAGAVGTQERAGTLGWRINDWAIAWGLPSTKSAICRRKPP